MVSKKKLDFEINGFRAPIVPRAPRSFRRRGPSKKMAEDNNLCAFELLAAVAGKLLQESESSASSNIADEKLHLGISMDGNDVEQPKKHKRLRSESYDHGSCAESAFVPEISVEERNLVSNFKGASNAENGSVVENNYGNESPDFTKKVDCDIKLGICEDNKVEIGLETKLDNDKDQIGDLSSAKTPVKDAIGMCVNTNTLINSESSVQLPLYRDPIPLRKHWNKNVKLGIRDDDENSFGCNKFSTRVRPLRPQARVRHRRITKMLASKYWKAAPRMKSCELYKTSDGMNTYYRYRKGVYTRETCQHVPIKKRKLSYHSFANPYEHDVSSASISNLPDQANGTSSTLQGHQATKDPNVRFSIKSFKVPELYIEVPETATVGSLKRTVMEAVTAILGGGIRVGIALQGKKVRDDSRTLQQAGISESSTLDTLGFTLEPNFTNSSPSKSPMKHHLVPLCDANPQIQRFPATPVTDSGISNASIETHIVTKLGDGFDSKEFVSSPKTPIDVSMDGGVVSDSQALVPVPSMNVDQLAVLPVNSKPKRTDSQRRTRRPFSVSEVEALVEAVEKLGTGRWRDVKMRAFEDADHRTYVDLKDKWKTLVHTASIAPQQRRGEPVPQHLLDRVLCVHSYWTQNQPKQNGKHLSLEPLKTNVDGRGEMIVGA